MNHKRREPLIPTRAVGMSGKTPLAEIGSSGAGKKTNFQIINFARTIEPRKSLGAGRFRSALSNRGDFEKNSKCGPPFSVNLREATEKSLQQGCAQTSFLTQFALVQVPDGLFKT